jgi:hypothetical protein
MQDAERMPSATPPLQAMARELESARALLTAQDALESAIRAGKRGAALTPLIQRQQETARIASGAALERRRWFDGPGSLEAWLARHPEADAQAMRRLAAEGAAIRREVLRTASRGQYVVRRCLEWSQAQLALLVQCATRDDTTYGGLRSGPPSPRAPSLLDQRV